MIEEKIMFFKTNKEKFEAAKEEAIQVLTEKFRLEGEFKRGVITDQEEYKKKLSVLDEKINKAMAKEMKAYVQYEKTEMPRGLRLRNHDVFHGADFTFNT